MSATAATTSTASSANAAAATANTPAAVPPAASAPSASKERSSTAKYAIAQAFFGAVVGAISLLMLYKNMAVSFVLSAATAIALMTSATLLYMCQSEKGEGLYTVVPALRRKRYNKPNEAYYAPHRSGKYRWT
jgi:hypothetical protein